MTFKHEIFVFGSNLAGRHGKGAALTAWRKYGAEYGIGHGRTGNAYAIPTKSAGLQSLTLHEIKNWINCFVRYAKEHPELKFRVTRIGCGLAGYKDNQIAPFFKYATENCILPVEWKRKH